MKIKKEYFILPIISLILSACSSDLPGQEEEITLQSITRMITDSAAKAVNYTEENQEISLKNITWDEAEDSTDGTVVNSHFSDGTVVRNKLSCHVENVEYMDFTGDGTPEAVIYGYDTGKHAQIHIFEINSEQKQLRELTPEFDIPGFQDKEWEISLLETQQDNVQLHGLRFVAYAKEDSCMEQERTFFYKAPGWEEDQVTYFFNPSGKGAAEAGQITALESISWSREDFAGFAEMPIHFKFCDGTGVDQWIIGLPREAVCMDFTGDGNLEVIIYSYFANTAREYDLINIFQVMEGEIKELTPAADIAEYAGEVWDASLIEIKRENWYHGLELTSCSKMNGLAYTDKYMVVYYKNGKWVLDEIIYYDFDESWLEGKE